MVAAAHFAHLPLVTPATVTVTVRHADEAAVLPVTVVLGVGREAGPFRRRRLGRLPDACTHTHTHQSVVVVVQASERDIGRLIIRYNYRRYISILPIKAVRGRLPPLVLPSVNLHRSIASVNLHRPPLLTPTFVLVSTPTFVPRLPLSHPA
jgi:hypothetical protein